MLAGLARYQGRPREVRPAPAPEIAAIGSVSLRDYGGDGPDAIFIPSLINPPDVLDLSAEASLLRWLSLNGVRPLLVDWGTPGPAELALDLVGYVEHRLLPLLARFEAPLRLVGYCMGGTLAMGLAGRRPVESLALLATPSRFVGYEAAARAAVAAHRAAAAPLAAVLGAWPMDLVQPGFWALDPAALAAKFERFAAMPDGPGADAFVALEDWANAGPPVPLGVVAGLAAAIADGSPPFAMPEPMPLILDVVATRDRIVPPGSALSAVDTPGVERLALPLGHVGMIVGSRARAALWEPLAAWLRGEPLPRAGASD